MENDPLKNARPALKNISLTPEEKSTMRLKLIEHMREHPIFPRMFGLPGMFFMRPLLGGVLAVLVIISGTGAAALSVEGSLPGDVLYPLKTGVSEPIAGFFKNASLKAKVAFEWELVEKRLVEAEQLPEDTLAAQKETIRMGVTKQQSKAENLARKLIEEENGPEASRMSVETLASAPKITPKEAPERSRTGAQKKKESYAHVAPQSGISPHGTGTELSKIASLTVEASTTAEVKAVTAPLVPTPPKEKAVEVGRKMFTEMDRIFERHEDIVKKLDLLLPYAESMKPHERPASSTEQKPDR